MSGWKEHVHLAMFCAGTVAIVVACGVREEPSRPSAPSASEADEQPPPVALTEPLALHMRDHLSLATQARDAIVRGKLEDATGALTWLAQHQERNATEAAKPFVERIRASAQRALDSGDLAAAGHAIGEMAASCGDCHRASGAGPKLEPSGQEELDTKVTLETHMHGYLWASETLWQALVGDPALWPIGVAALAELEPPVSPRHLAPDFAAVHRWALAASSFESSQARAEAYGQLIALCGNCHVRRAVVP